MRLLRGGRKGRRGNPVAHGNASLLSFPPMPSQPHPGPERRARDRSQGITLRRRENQITEVERRRPIEGTAEIAAALELHLDQCKTRRAMLTLIETWLGEARNAPPDAQDPA